MQPLTIANYPLPLLTLKNVCQGLIFLISGYAVYCMSGGKHKRAFILNLLVAPCWWYSNAASGLWGMFALSLYHSGMQVRGLIHHRKEKI